MPLVIEILPKHHRGHFLGHPVVYIQLSDESRSQFNVACHVGDEVALWPLRESTHLRLRPHTTTWNIANALLHDQGGQNSCIADASLC